MAGLTRRPGETASACQPMRALPCCGGSGGDEVVPAVPFDFVMIQLASLSGTLGAPATGDSSYGESGNLPLYGLRLPWQSSLWHEGMATNTPYTANKLPFGIIPPDFLGRDRHNMGGFDLMHTRLAWALAAAALILFTGCSAPASVSTPTATGTPTGSDRRACQPLGTVNQTLTQLAGTGDNTTIGEVKAAQQKLDGALTALAALPGSRGSAYDTIKSASDQLAAAVKDMPDRATVGQAGPRLQEFKGKAAQAQAAATKLASLLNCKT